MSANLDSNTPAVAVVFAVVFVFANVPPPQDPCASCALCRGPIYPHKKHRCPEVIFCFVSDQPDNDDAPGGVGILAFSANAPSNQLGVACVFEALGLAIGGAVGGTIAGTTAVAEGVGNPDPVLVFLLGRWRDRFTGPAVLCELLETPTMGLVPFEPVLNPREIQARAIAAGVLRVEETEDVGFIKPGHENCSTCGTGTYRQERLLGLARRQTSRLRPHLLVVPSAKGRKQGECAICRMDFEKNGEPISMVHENAHGHFFHTECINKWFDQCERNPGRLLRYTCPLCAQEVV